MAKYRQHHFVVYYDESTDQWNVDYDTQDVKFDNKPIYDPAKDEWMNVSGEIEDENSTYNRAADALYEAVTNLPLRAVDDSVSVIETDKEA